MTENQLRIVTHGRIAAGFDRATVEANLIRLCQYSPERVARVFSGHPFVFKSGLDRVEANRYLHVLSKTGIVCRIVPGPAPAPSETAAVRPVRRVAAPAVGAITCPYCSTVQESTAVCVGCGSLIDPRPISVGDYTRSQPAVKKGATAIRWVLVLAVFVGAVALLAYGSTRLQVFVQSRMQQQLSSFDNARYILPSDVPIPEHPPVSQVKFRLSVAEGEQLKQLLADRQFAPLNTRLEAIQQEYERDPGDDTRICQAFGIFYDAHPAQRPLYDAWVAATPGHFAPHLARGNYLAAMGWEARGSRWASETSDAQFDAMGGYFDRALADFDAALKLNPRLLPAYISKISIAKAHDPQRQEQAIQRQARKLFPLSYQLYRKLLDANLPRWGGSYPQMTLLASEVNQHAAENPEFSFLYGKVYIDQAWYAKRNNDYPQAIALYTQALAFGEYAELLEMRALAYEGSNQPELAIADYRRALEINPDYTDAAYRLATLLYRRGDVTAALELVQAAQPRTAPRNRNLLAWYNWTIKNLVRAEQPQVTDMVRAANAYLAAAPLRGTLPRQLPPARTSFRFNSPGGTKPYGLAWFNEALYLSSYQGADGIYRLNPESGAILQLFTPDIVYKGQYGGLAADSRQLFHIQGHYDNDLFLLAPQNLEKTGQRFLYASQLHYSDLAQYRGDLFAVGYHLDSDLSDYRLLRFSPEGQLRATFALQLPDGPAPSPGLTCDGTHLWLALGATLLKIEPESGTLIAGFSLPGDVRGLAWDGRQLWGATVDGKVMTIAVND